ncbi:MAG TPA: aminoglycoside phosphotransferase family protein [Pyrinomonadaceae bacterium]|jgi:tRNA A-37 threonylcarbamoyl transferase component Bud32|nr:aminoglycoside phosphotransferase family protein [Pyrinomonadaceae bacterium]
MDDSAKNEDLNEFLFHAGLLKRGEKAVWTSLSGGVSSDIWRVCLPGQTICVKRALATLKVEADWQAPTERNIYEWEWFKFVHQNFPEIVPHPLAHDNEKQMLAMEFLAPEDFKVWKTALLNGEADAEFAGKVGTFLGKIHAKSAFNQEIAATFSTDKLFYALRIEPYLLATAEKHASVAPKIREIAEKTLSAKIALVHGDVSPKNILIGRENPVFLDAETAWFGDPAFDPAFCLNHFLLKKAFLPQFASGYEDCFKAFAEGYLSQVNWEPREEIEARTARLLPILHLARIDGKSPVEYIRDEKLKNQIRQSALNLILNPKARLSEII